MFALAKDSIGSGNFDRQNFFQLAQEKHSADSRRRCRPDSGATA
jgi:hypothetical protein